MKKHIWLAAAAVVALLPSCAGFLEEKTYSFVSGEDLYTTAANAELALTGVYDILNASGIQGTGNHPMWGRGMHYLLMLGDEVAPNDITDSHHQVMAACAYNSEAEFISHAWLGLFVGIDRANHIIQKVPAIDMDEERKAEIIAEARLLRGFYRLYLAWLWGEVPLPNEPNSPADAPRRPLVEVYADIEADLLHAFEVLPDRNSRVVGRVNKWTAGGFLAKMYVYLASCAENNVGRELGADMNDFGWVDVPAAWAAALEFARLTYEQSGYRLITPYAFNFLADTKSHQKEECLMVVQTGVGGTSEYYLFPYLSGPQGNVGVNGGGYGWWRPTGEVAENYSARDGRFAWNITGGMGSRTDNVEIINGVRHYVPEAVSSSGSNMCFGKFRQSDPEVRLTQGYPTWASNIDFPILRFADVVLLYGEALYKTGNEPLAREKMQEVRQRACTDQDGNVDVTALDMITADYRRPSFMDELLEERMRELCVEGWRRIDLMRTGRLTATMESIETEAVGQYYYFAPKIAVVKNNYSPYKMWLPIPKREREVNRNLTQNPGYPQDI